ncbi:MAG TPA: zinc ribbon domain-containing protein, partial [Clostridia bacterium]
NRGGLKKSVYEILESEANIFASEILSPYQVLICLNWTNYKSIQIHCGLSTAAAKTRASQIFDLMLNNVYIDENCVLYQNFYEFIHTKHCPQCGYFFVSKNAKYCPICGNKKLIWGEGCMKYKGIATDENGMALICPKCGNEEVNKGDKYCKICGAYLIQMCTNESCKYKPANNARYCPKCGSITTFFEQDFLIPWEKEKKELEAQNKKLRNKIEDADVDLDFNFEEIDSKEPVPF